MFSIEFIAFLSILAFVPILVIAASAGRYDIALGLLFLVFLIIVETFARDDIVSDKYYDIESEVTQEIIKYEKSNYVFYNSVKVVTRMGTFVIGNDFGLKEKNIIKIKTYQINKNRAKDINHNKFDKIVYQLCAFDKYEQKEMCYIAEKKAN